MGVALLRSHGTMRDVMEGRIFDQEQIARPAELGIGAASASAIRLLPIDTQVESVAEKIQQQLDARG